MSATHARQRTEKKWMDPWEETLDETNIGTWAVCAAEQRGTLHQRDQERAILPASWVCGHEVFMSVSL